MLELPVIRGRAEGSQAWQPQNYKVGHFSSISTARKSDNFGVGNCSSGRENLWIDLQMQRVLAVLLCPRGQFGKGTAVGWSWAKGDSSGSCPSLPSPSAMAVPSALTHLGTLSWEFICSFLRAFDLPLYPATALQSAPVRKHCLLPAAVRPPWGSAARSHQHLPRLPPLTGLQDISVPAPVTSLPRLYRGTRPHVALPWHIFILCPHLSPAAS